LRKVLGDNPTFTETTVPRTNGLSTLAPIREADNYGAFIVPWDTSVEAKEMYEIEEARGFLSDEEMLDTEMTIGHTLSEMYQEPVSAEDRFKLRKPRCYNRITTGVDWNKYNQMHYDLDNPPPKIVLGYKFNIFYPDLIDKVSAS
jgi:hypothetical protein